ncbi:MAG: ribosome biogenesis GTPase YlqF [Candidatus Syntrophonatronum acetioxidans]|uniref:Ribosome biogenesis GTPase A n=1 Tax=Candidatus Syntrophonatronum acetioxidans TaxID=1795816 RepID=A0A424YBP9_9FIRM|nr:MAG: ribosome biogenesis GTPase YlqF [Candidatus Syntrophonatronum acetioxidans]
MDSKWYPGHMKKARQVLKENIRLVSVVIELLDARIPLSSQNPDLNNIIGGKNKIIVLNKSDLADEQKTSRWLSFFKEEGHQAVSVNSVKGHGIKKLKAILGKLKGPVSKGKRPVRVMVIGIPNVGKSSFINSLVGRSVVKTGGKPGITRGKQWIKISPGLELLDTPGILWPQVDREDVAFHLAVTGAIKFEQLDTVELAYRLLKLLAEEKRKGLEERYKIEIMPSLDNIEVLIKAIGSRRGFLKAGGEVDIPKTTELILKDFREGLLGRITLEEPPL